MTFIERLIPDPIPYLLYGGFPRQALPTFILTHPALVFAIARQIHEVEP